MGKSTLSSVPLPFDDPPLKLGFTTEELVDGSGIQANWAGASKHINYLTNAIQDQALGYRRIFRVDDGHRYSVKVSITCSVIYRFR